MAVEGSATPGITRAGSEARAGRILYSNSNDQFQWIEGSMD